MPKIPNPSTDFIGKAEPVTADGLSAALDVLGLAPNDAAYFWAIAEVETADVTQGFGFRPDRRPQLLFERHKFREFTAGQFNQVAPDVSGPAGGHGTCASQYDRLDKAVELCLANGFDIELALKAASWGLGQVMGFNHQAAGFASAAAMVTSFKESENKQVMGMALFLAASRLDKCLRNRDWTAFAKGYNGRDYWKNHYDIKLAQQFERFSTGSLPNLEVRTAQAALLLTGYSPGKIDGVLGDRTRRAVQRFRVDAGLSPGNTLDTSTFEAVCNAAGFVNDRS